MTDAQKLQIVNLITIEIDRLGSQTAVANKCSVSDATIDQIRKGKYIAKGDDMYLKIAAALGWKPQVWTVVHDTMDTKTMVKVLNDAKRKSMFMAVANKAGSGKSAGCDLFMEKYPHNVFYIECQEWSQTDFLTRLLKTLGVDPSPGRPVPLLLEKLLYFFAKRVGRPLLIIDQANSLKPSVLSFIIHLYNECEDKLGLVLIGTPHLEQMIKAGVKKNYKYYDEIDSRLGRKYVKLMGATLGDVRKICAANGITDADKQLEIYNECDPVDKWLDENRTRKVQVVEDMRRLKRVIQREQLKIEDATDVAA